MKRKLIWSATAYKIIWSWGGMVDEKSFCVKLFCKTQPSANIRNINVLVLLQPQVIWNGEGDS